MSLSPPPCRGYLFDLDGTIYLGEEVIPGAAEALARLRARGAKLMFVTNKPLYRPDTYAQRLTGLGIPAQPDEVLTSALALGDYMAQQAAGCRTLLIGEEVLREEVSRAGVIFTDDPTEAEVVAVGWDRAFSYDKLNAALQALRRGAKLYATNPDVTCPLGPDEFVPDCGALLAAITACSGHAADYIAGKPGPGLPATALARLGLAAQDCAMVGDRLETDITCGNRHGLQTIAVLTGVTTAQMAAEAQGEQRPAYVIASVAQLQ
jgi:HAD superfamily hydrolase (TIGR01450 family)